MYDLRYMFTRKHAGQEYKFFLLVPFRESERSDPKKYAVHVHTPENCFGYEDTVCLNDIDGKAYTLWRYLPPYILRALEKQMKKLLSDVRRSLCA